MQFIENLFKSNDWKFRLLRTIFQGVLAVLITSLSTDTFDWKFVLVACIPAVLSPIMAELGKYNEGMEEENKEVTKW